MRFALLMAWRDFRAKPSRFLFYVFAIALGVGSLVAIDSLRLQLGQAIQAQGRNLLGADLSLRSRRVFTPEQEALLTNWPGRAARSISYRTLLLDPDKGGTRLVEVEATAEGYPFYGGFQTEPADAGMRFTAAGQVLVDQSVMLQLDLQAGTEVMIGGQPFVVAGAVTQSPGEVPARSMISPKVYMPLALVDEPRLRSPGTMANFEWYGALPEGADESVVRSFAGRARALGLDAETVASRREQLLGSTDRIGRYLGLMGFTSLMIGCLGVAGAVYFFIASKRPAVAQLRCIGATLFQAAGLFVVQLFAVAVIGATGGLAFGWLIASALPSLLSPFLPVVIDARLHPSAIASAWAMGVLFTVLAGLLPITRLRMVHPLDSLRHQTTASGRRWDAAGLLVMAAMMLMLVVFARYQLGSMKLAAAYLGGVAVVLGLLVLTGYAIRALCRLVVRPGWPYTVRLAVSGLYRPQNQTGLLVASLGLGCFLLNAVDLLEQHVVSDFETSGQARPNLAMIDIQLDQRQPLLDELARFETKATYVEPMVTMRLTAINGRSIRDLESAPGGTRPNWVLNREYRTTYRAHQKPEIEKVIAGKWISEPFYGGMTSNVPVSLEQGIAESLRVTLGDTLTFDVHGIKVVTYVANLREVDWKSMQPNFFILFPPGVLEDAPQTFLVFNQMDDRQQRADFQRSVAALFPNVTVIDISLMLDTVAAMTGQLAAAIRTIAWFTVAAGFLVLMAILRAGAAQRQRESVLLRTIGASRRVIAGRQVLEFLVVTLAAMASGLVLSWIAIGAVIHFGMKLPYRPDFAAPWPTMAVLLVITLAVGWLNARSATRQRPADAWRALSMTAS